MRAEPNGFLVHHLSHSVTVSMIACNYQGRPQISHIPHTPKMLHPSSRSSYRHPGATVAQSGGPVQWPGPVAKSTCPVQWYSPVAHQWHSSVEQASGPVHWSSPVAQPIGTVQCPSPVSQCTGPVHWSIPCVKSSGPAHPAQNPTKSQQALCNLEVKYSCTV